MSVTLKQLEIFNAVVVAGSISKATRWVKLSQPTISQQLAKMEEALGTQLIVRARGPSLKLTPAGEYWFRSSSEILAQVEAVEAVHESHFREDRMAIRLGTTPSLRGRFIGTAARLAVAQKKFSRFEFVWGLNSAEVVKQMTLHQINCGVVSATSIEDQGAALHSVRLFDDRVVWAVPQSIPHSAIEAVLAARTPPPPRFEALARYVEIGGGVPWHDGSENWYRAHLPFAMPYFGCLTHQGAVEFVAAGLATCHVPLSLMPSLPDTLRRELRIYNLRGFRRTAVFIMPRHLLSLRPFAEFQEQLCDFASRDYQDEMHMAEVPDAPLPPDPAPPPAAAASGKAMDSIGQRDAASGSNGPQEPAVRQGGAVMILPADRGPGP